MQEQNSKILLKKNKNKESKGKDAIKTYSEIYKEKLKIQKKIFK